MEQLLRNLWVNIDKMYRGIVYDSGKEMRGLVDIFAGKSWLSDCIFGQFGNITPFQALGST